jgi:hypothetical protein
VTTPRGERYYEIKRSSSFERQRREAATATTAIAVITAAVSAVFIFGGQLEEAAYRFGFIAGRIGGMSIDGAMPVWLTPFSATLVHVAGFTSVSTC